MEKPARTVLIAITVSLMFIGGVQAQQKGGSRVIYEENTSFEDAKRRARILSEIKAQKPQGEDKPEQKQLVTDAWMEKIMPFIEKFLGPDAAALFKEYKNGSSDKQQSALDGQTDKCNFREFSDKHQWKGLRRVQNPDEGQE